MGKLIYSMMMSLDGYVNDPDGHFDWGVIDAETHGFVNELSRSVGTYLHGRRMYETMVYWETAHTEPDQPPCILEYADIWRGGEKIVYSTTMNDVAANARASSGPSTRKRCGG